MAPPPVAVAPLAEIVPLRHAVLRPGRPLADAHFAEDALPGTFHLAARPARTAPPVGVTSVCPVPYPAPARPAPHPALVGPDAWQLRGMAVDPAARRQGVAAALCAAAIDEVAARGGRALWCNARLVAVGVYERAGFLGDGDLFEVPGIGPHLRMWRLVPGTPPDPQRA